MDLKPDGLCVYETTKQDSIIPFFIILNFLNKKESNVICKRVFEIILLQTQSLSIKPFNYKRLFVMFNKRVGVFYHNIKHDA